MSIEQDRMIESVTGHLSAAVCAMGDLVDSLSRERDAALSEVSRLEHALDHGVEEVNDVVVAYAVKVTELTEELAVLRERVDVALEMPSENDDARVQGILMLRRHHDHACEYVMDSDRELKTFQSQTCDTCRMSVLLSGGPGCVLPYRGLWCDDVNVPCAVVGNRCGKWTPLAKTRVDNPV